MTHVAWWAKRVRAGPPGQLDPRTIRVFERLVAPVIRLMHRPKLEGLEHLPSTGAYLLVANHSGAAAASELFSLTTCWLRQCGPQRPLAAMAHPVGFVIWPLMVFIRGVGAIPSTYEATHAALAAGVPVLIFPGGDYESTRPIWRANIVGFGGRKGFLRIARDARATIVPMGIRGSHWSVPILWQSRLLAWLSVLPRLLGIKRMPLTLLGVAGAAAILAFVGPSVGWAWASFFTWAWLASPFTMLPWVPSTIRMRIGTPITAAELFAESEQREPSDAQLTAAYDRIEAAVQRLVDRHSPSANRSASSS